MIIYDLAMLAIASTSIRVTIHSLLGISAITSIARGMVLFKILLKSITRFIVRLLMQSTLKTHNISSKNDTHQ